jgi:hypothetical protein
MTPGALVIVVQVIEVAKAGGPSLVLGAPAYV